MIQRKESIRRVRLMAAAHTAPPRAGTCADPNEELAYRSPRAGSPVGRSGDQVAAVPSR